MKNILDAVQSYSDKSYNAKRNAQHNLDGRTHWADDDSLAFFGCKISRSFDDANGKLFAVCYSQKAGFDNPTREYGFIIFDLFGDCVTDQKFDSGKARDKGFVVTLKQCVTHADLITQTGRDNRIARLRWEIELLEGVE